MTAALPTGITFMALGARMVAWDGDYDHRLITFYVPVRCFAPTRTDGIVPRPPRRSAGFAPARDGEPSAAGALDHSPGDHDSS